MYRTPKEFFGANHIYPNNNKFYCETLDKYFTITSTANNGIVTANALGKEATFGYTQLETPVAISIANDGPDNAATLSVFNTLLNISVVVSKVVISIPFVVLHIY